jgi:hypothetical protein
VSGDGLSVAPAKLTRNEGGRVDTSLILMPDEPAIDKLKQEHGLELVVNNKGNLTEIQTGSLQLDTPIQTQRFGIFNIIAFHLSGMEKVRCQATFRESDSWNGFLARDKNGIPFLFDNGTRTKYLLDPKQAEQLQQIAAHNKPAGLPTFGPVKRVFDPVAPRAHLYGKTYYRKYITGTAAEGGAGKSTYITAELASMALGVDLLHHRIPLDCGPLQVGLLYLEDTIDEYQRQIQALAIHYNLADTEKQTLASNIHVLPDDDGRLKIVEKHDHKVVRNQDAIDYLTRHINQHGVDVLVIDPLISIHESDENTTKEMQPVVAALRSISRCRADGVAVHYVQHNRKGGGSSVDDMRGSSSLKDGSRVVRNLSRMPEKFAKDRGVAPSIAKHLIGISDGKNNLAAEGSKQWFRKHSVCLNNGTTDLPPDYMPVVERFELPEFCTGLDLSQVRQVLQVIQAADPAACRSDIRATQWTGKLIAPVLGLDPSKPEEKDQVKTFLKALTDAGFVASSNHHISDVGKEKSVHVVKRIPDVASDGITTGENDA